MPFGILPAALDALAGAGVAGWRGGAAARETPGEAAGAVDDDAAVNDDSPTELAAGNTPGSADSHFMISSAMPAGPGAAALTN